MTSPSRTASQCPASLTPSIARSGVASTEAPAVISAIQDACGIWITSLPATPDKVKAALAAGR